jgi:hypothetical protein
MAVGGFYSKVEQGAKGHGPSEAWFGRKKHERKKDELLSYLHHARNSEEHSLEGSTEKTPIRATAGNKWTTITNDGSDGTGIQVVATSHEKVSVKLHPSGFRLVTVRDDRYGDSFDPPQIHLGQPLPEYTVVGVLLATEAYLTRMLDEASILAPHS